MKCYLNIFCSDNSTKLIETNSLFNNSIPNTELERMQQLAKLVNSMQMVNEHIESRAYFFFRTKCARLWINVMNILIFLVIDSTLFAPKPEESYIKELTRIRQEVDTLKQTAALNNSMTSSAASINNFKGVNKTLNNYWFLELLKQYEIIFNRKYIELAKNIVNNLLHNTKNLIIY